MTILCEQIKKETPPMIIVPHRKIKSHADTLTFLLDPARFKTFIMDLRTYLRSTQHLFQKEGYENDPRNCVHRSMYDRPESVLFRRFHHFCDKQGLDWEGAREMLEIMLNERFLCECEVVWRLKDEQVKKTLLGCK